ncbi:hypothetical protein [Streptomyces endophyticus]|uniref:Integral membrane protein n=1 Tax=Streptomyces endophyticus TaxID=714166 RepID=A0ABU6F972_9ACTN|nr:hypothetical protein [Streptomyces endophyticus]MEB8340584.1 hypothetical protein [Streptomyces endophyticus]
MPANRLRRALSRTAVVTGVQATAVLLASRAWAAPDPDPSDNPCDLIRGAARKYCERGNESNSGSTGGGGGAPDVSNPLDPLSSLAKGCAEAASWTVDQLSDAVQKTANVDFTNPKFLQQYAVVFAASTILTLVLWLLAVAKRAVRGVPLMTAITEAVGFLWLTVLASAFTPLILYTVVSAADGVSDVLAKATGNQTDAFFGTFSQALKKGDNIGGGPIMLIVVSLVSIVAAGVLYLELYLRAVLLYVGALLGVVVYAGLVDKNLWGHVRRWVGVMIAVILVKPVIVIVLGLAGALSSSDKGPDSLAAIVSGLAIVLLAIFASGMIYRFVPGFGDEMANVRKNRLMQGAEGKAAAVMSSPAALVSQGIKTHSSRQDGGGSGGGGGASQARPANPASGGVAAHSSRQGGAGGGGGTVPSAAPSPRTSPSKSPHASNDRGSNSGNTGKNGNWQGGAGR